MTKSLSDRLAELAAIKKPIQSKLPDAHFGKVGKPLNWRTRKLIDDRDDDETRRPPRSTIQLIGFNPFGKPKVVK